MINKKQIHFVCLASPVHYQHVPVQIAKTSVHGSINMRGLAKRLNTKIFQASTSEVYGDPKNGSPTIRLEKGLINTISYFDQLLKSSGRLSSEPSEQSLYKAE